jgi:hypothetical protein
LVSSFCFGVEYNYYSGIPLKKKKLPQAAFSRDLSPMAGNPVGSVLSFFSPVTRYPNASMMGRHGPVTRLNHIGPASPLVFMGYPHMMGRGRHRMNIHRRRGNNLNIEMLRMTRFSNSDEQEGDKG